MLYFLPTLLAGEAHSGGDYSEDESLTEDGRTTFIEHDVAVSKAPKRLKHKHRIPTRSAGKENTQVQRPRAPNSGRGKQLPNMPGRKTAAEEELEKAKETIRELKERDAQRVAQDREQRRKQRDQKSTPKNAPPPKKARLTSKSGAQASQSAAQAPKSGRASSKSSQPPPLAPHEAFAPLEFELFGGQSPRNWMVTPNDEFRKYIRNVGVKKIFGQVKFTSSDEEVKRVLADILEGSSQGPRLKALKKHSLEL